MSLKACTRLLPHINSVKGASVSLFRPVLVQVNNEPPSLYNLPSNNYLRFSSTKPQNKIKEIYYGILTPQIRAVKMFSLTSSIVGVIAQPFLYKEIASIGNVPIIIAAYSAIGFFTFVTPLLLHLITKKYITHLNYEEDSGRYIAKTVNFFCISKETKFTPEEVTVPEVPGMFTTFVVKGKSLFIDPRYFDQPDHYAKIMGFDKPIDFKLYESPPDTNKKN